ncbi:twitching motility protein PilT [Lachnospiraceae bacterium WCA-693-APC-MOT-I]|uniref:Twitching motility protein PilT n=2 Tax=Velocimicrobium porci TaxID=2606634 RepID=A0A6L5Y2N9_9FIRM|nr:twitching motility protein PilT [Velocimicrobium porci]
MTMIQIIAGEKGKGKTKVLLDKVNTEIKSVAGTSVYLDKNTKHMYELNNKIRLINVNDFLVTNYNEFLGFICGIISQDHDLEIVYLDSFLKIACLTEENLELVLNKLSEVSNTFHINFVLSISLPKDKIPSEYQKDIIVAL